MKVSSFPVRDVDRQGASRCVGGFLGAAFSKMDLAERGVGLDIRRIQQERDLELGSRPQVVALKKKHVSQIEMRASIVGNEVGPGREGRCCRFEILLVLLQRPDHLVDGVASEKWFQRERCLQFAQRVRPLSLAQKRQSYEKTPTRTRPNRKEPYSHRKIKT